MKKAIKKNIVLVMLFTMLCSYGTEISSLRNNEDGKTILMLENVKAGEQLIIKDIHGLVLFKESIEKDGNYSKSFDLTDLPDGNYNFELDSYFKIKIIPFKVLLNAVKFDKSNEQVIYKPYVLVKDDMLYITKLNMKKSPLDIKLLYNNGDGYNLLYSETIEKTIDIKRVYKISKEQKGVYKLVFKSEGRIIEKRITI